MDSTKAIRIHQPPRELLDLGNWFPLANAYVDHLLASVGPTDFAVLLAIKRELHGFNRSRGRVSQREVMRLTGLSRRGVQQSLARLADAGHLIVTEIGTGRQSTEYLINEALMLPVHEPNLRGARNAPLDDEETVEAHEMHPTGAGNTPQGDTCDASTSTSKDTVKDREKDYSDSISSLSQQVIDGWPAIQRELVAQCGTRAAYNTYLDGLTPQPTGNGQIILRGHRPYETAFADSRLRPWILRALRAVITEPFEDKAVVIVGPDQPAELLQLTPAGD